MLRPRRAAFVRAYLTHGNATQAAKEARYSARSAYSTGQRLLKNAEVRAAILEGRQALAARSELTRDNLVRDLHEEFKAALGGKTPQAAARLGELLARLHGWIDDKPQQSNQTLVNFVVQR